MQAQAKHMRSALMENKKAADAAVTAAETSRKSMEISNRANVAIRNVELIHQFGHSGHLGDWPTLAGCKVQIEVENAGPTNARAFYFELRLEIPGAIQVERTPGPTVSHPSELPPKGFIVESTGQLSQYFTMLDLQNSVIKGKLEANGFMRYRDIFDHAYFVEFKSTLDPVTRKFRITLAEKPDGQRQQQ